MKRTLLLLTAALVSGCASEPQKPIIQTTTVEKPVPVRCKIQRIEKPRLHLNEVQAGDSVLVKGNAAIAELRELKAYSAVVESALLKCADQSD